MVEKLDNLIHKIDELMQRWDDRLTLHGSVLSERYVEGKLSVHVHVRCFRPGNKAIEFCAIHERTDQLGTAEGKVAYVDTLPGGKAQTSAAQGAPDDIKHLVFVPIVERVEDLEGMRGEVIPSLVRLKPLDCFHCRLARSLYFSPARGFVFISLPEDRELGSSGSCLGRSAAVNYQLPSQVIKRGPQIVRQVPYDGAQAKRRIFRDPNLRDLLSCIRVGFSDNAIRVEIKELPNCHLELTEVLLGPFDLCPAPVEMERHRVDLLS